MLQILGDYVPQREHAGKYILKRAVIAVSRQNKKTIENLCDDGRRTDPNATTIARKEWNSSLEMNLV